MMRNRKGQLSIILLFVVALALVGMTLFTFVSFKGDFDLTSTELSDLVVDLEFKYQYVLSEAELISQSAITSKVIERIEEVETPYESEVDNPKNKYVIIASEREKARVEGSYNFFKKARDRDFEFEFNDVDNKYVLSIENLFVKSESGESSITRNFDLFMEFDSNGNVLKREIMEIS